MKNRILVVAVHPDDETLGCGGTLLKHKSKKDEINWLICTTIDKQKNNYQMREKEINKVSKLYGFNSVHNLRLKTMRVDEYSMSILIEKISKVTQRLAGTTCSKASEHRAFGFGDDRLCGPPNC